jgi:hypothetical protein
MWPFWPVQAETYLSPIDAGTYFLEFWDWFLFVMKRTFSLLLRSPKNSKIGVNIFLIVHFQGFWLDQGRKKPHRFSNGKRRFHNLNCLQAPRGSLAERKKYFNSVLPKMPKS